MFIRQKDFDPEKIAHSGQCFRMAAEDGGFRVRALGRCARLSPCSGGYMLDCPGEDEPLWRRYFDLDSDYGAFLPDPGDEYLCRAYDLARGVRILRQDPFEALITFIISQRKNIPAIRMCVEKLCGELGEEGNFPTPGAIAACSEERLRGMSLGYRAPYVLGTARMVNEGELDLEACGALDDQALERALCRAPGVGVKVAKCVMLFAYHRLDAFPVDVWIDRTLKEKYPQGFDMERYRGYAGVMQQYLFFAAKKGCL